MNMIVLLSSGTLSSFLLLIIFVAVILGVPLFVIGVTLFDDLLVRRRSKSKKESETSSHPSFSDLMKNLTEPDRNDSAGELVQYREREDFQPSEEGRMREAGSPHAPRTAPAIELPAGP